MLNARIRKAAERFLPKSLRRILDPFEAVICDRLAAFASELPASARVLDAGAGESRYRALFTRQQYVGIDNGAGAASWNYSRLDVIGNIEQIPFADGAFQAVISVVVLEHTREPRQVVAEMARVTRPAGKIFLVVPDQWEVHQAPNDFFRFTRYGVEHLMNAGGFRVQQIVAVGGFGWLMSRRSINVLTFFQGGVRWPVFVVAAPFLGLLLPAFFYWADRFDRRRDFTLGYICVAERI
jgi:SAM-dependent methyltransferase